MAMVVFPSAGPARRSRNESAPPPSSGSVARGPFRGASVRGRQPQLDLAPLQIGARHHDGDEIPQTEPPPRPLGSERESVLGHLKRRVAERALRQEAVDAPR